MRILVCVKYVPDEGEDVQFTPELTLNRQALDGLLSELDEFAVEQALRLRSELPGATVTALMIAPQEGEAGLRKALQMGADDAVLVSDDAVRGSDVFATATILAAAARHLSEVGVVICGMSSPDAGTGVVPALIAESLDWPLLSLASEVVMVGDSLRITRTDEIGTRVAQAALPAVLSVTDRSGQPRYPSFKDVLAAKRKSVVTLALADLGVEAGAVGLDASRVRVVKTVRNPDRGSGRVVVDNDGDSVDLLVEFLTGSAN